MERGNCSIAALYVAFNILSLTLRTGDGQMVHILPWRYNVIVLDHVTSSVICDHKIRSGWLLRERELY